MDVFGHISAMEPLMPNVNAGQLAELSRDMFILAGRMSGRLPASTACAVAGVLRQMNSFYSNLIEGQKTFPRDVEAALKSEFSEDTKKADLQHLGLAHIQTEEAMRKRLEEEPLLDVTSTEFLCWLHFEFYSRLPESLRNTQGRSGKHYPVEGGRLRDGMVDVGSHTPPDCGALPTFLKRFSQAYSPPGVSATDQLVAAAAAHHRLLWIHPFFDGNGRVARLFSIAYLIRAQVDAGGFWSIARGLARNRAAYYANLKSADARRQNDYDGRGNLSAHGLSQFVDFFLNTALDQMRFMDGLLELDTLERRLRNYFLLETPFGKRSEAAFRLFFEVFRRGDVVRGEVPRITGKRETVGREILKDLMLKEWIVSDGERAPLRVGLPSGIYEVCFPRLFMGEASDLG